MTSNRQKVRLDTIANINPKRTIAKGVEVPFIDMAAVPQYSRNINVSDIEKRIAKAAGSHFKNGDTLLARITPCLENGKTAQVSYLNENDVGEGSTEFIVLCGLDEADNDFIYYLCREPSFREYAISRMEGTSGRQRVSWQSIAAYEFLCPPENVRRQAAQVLSDIDNRIQLLQETNKTLEQLAQALFKSWFVDFDPVNKKSLNDAPGLTHEHLDLFPDTFVETAIGNIPFGWNIGVLGDIVSLRNDRTKPNEKTLSLPYVPIESITSRTPFLNDSKAGSEANSSLALFYKGDILFGAMRPYFHKVCVAPFDGVTRTTVFTLMPNDVMAQNFALFQIFQKSTVDYATQHSEGSTIPYAKWKGSMENMPIVIPPDIIQHRFNNIVETFVNKANKNIEQIKTLSELRDSLLPRLINAHVGFGDQECIGLEDDF